MTRTLFGDSRRSDQRVVQMLKRYVHDQRAAAAIQIEPTRALRRRLRPRRRA